MAGSQTLRFDIIGDGSSASRAFKDTASNAALAARGAKQLSDTLGIQSKTAQASAAATVSLAKSDSVLRDAQLALAGATDDASGSLGEMKLRLDALNGKVAAARVSLDGDKEAQARLDAISARLTDLDHKTSTPSLDVQGVAKATAELSAIDVALDKVGGKGGSAQAAASSVGLLASPMGAAVAAGVALSPVLITASIGMAGLGAAAADTISPILQAGTATKKAQQALASLDPAQRAAYDSLGLLKTQFGGFAKSLEPETLGLFNKGLTLASGLLGDVEPVAAATGKALGGAVGEIDAEFRSGTWQKFFGFMAATAGPDIKLLGSLFVSLADDLPPLLEDLQPVATGFLGIATDALKAVGALERFEGVARQANQVADQSQKSGGNDPFSLGAIAGDAKRAGEGLLNSLYPGFTKVTGAAGKFAKSQGDAAGAASKNAEATRQQAAAQQAAVAAATGLSGNLTILEGRYNLTAAQATALVKAAGQTTGALSGNDAAATGALHAVEGYANASLAAKSPTEQLAADVAVLDNNTLGATLQLKAFTDAWNVLVGNSLSDQQAVLADESAFDALTGAIKSGGAGSLQARQAFVSYVQQIGTSISTLQQNGASVGQINSEYETNIKRLQALHNLTPAQRADVQGLIRDYDTWAASTAGLNSQTSAAAQTIKDKFTANLKALGEFTPSITGDVNNLANSVLKTGTTSAATNGDRAKLIADLRQSGLSAQSAAKLVDDLTGSLERVPKSVSTHVSVTASANGAITAALGGTNTSSIANIKALLQFGANGMLVSGGTPGKDSVLVAAMPGEVIVPTAMVQGGAVDHLRGKIPGFAGGGQVNLGAPYQFVSGDENSFVTGMGKLFMSQANAAFQASAKAAAALAGSPVPFSSAAGITQWEPDVARVLAMLGLPLADLPTVMSQMGTESGGNPNAINLTDINAQNGDPSKGLMQVISETFAAYRSPALSSNIYDPLANIFAGLNYAVHRYGNPGWLSVLGHGHGYDSGGYLPTGLSLAYNGTGKPEPVIPARQFIPGGRGSSGGEMHIKLELGSSFRRTGLTPEQVADIRATVNGHGGNVQTAFGRS
jgi:hypothetical protein